MGSIDFGPLIRGVMGLMLVIPATVAISIFVFYGIAVGPFMGGFWGLVLVSGISCWVF